MRQKKTDGKIGEYRHVKARKLKITHTIKKREKGMSLDE